MATSWNIKGELILNCNCEVFCPCVVSLGRHPPTNGQCHGWAGVEITAGSYDGERLDGLNVGLLLDIPGRMTDGNWTTALYVDDRASARAFEGVRAIFTGAAGGTSGLLKLLVGNFLGARQVPIRFEHDGKTRRFSIPKIVEGSIEPIAGDDPSADVVISNSGYWIGPEITISRGIKSKFRDFGRVWDLSGRSAEIVAIDWHGP